MKKIFAGALLLLGSLAVQAQDIITQRNAEEIEAKVLKVGDTTIEYKRADNPDGPVYVLPAREVFMIRYQNGSRDIINAWGSKFRTRTAPNHRPRYQGEVGFGFGLGVGRITDAFNTNRLSIETVHGVRVCPNFFAGAGLSYNLFYTDLPLRDEYGNPHGTYTSAGIVPAFANFKGYCPLTEKLSLYLSLDLGAAFGVCGYFEENETEFYTCVGPGISFGKAGRSARGDLSVRFQHMGENLNAVLFRVAFGF